MSTTLARLACDEPTARRLAAALGESLDAEDTVCAAFEDGDGRWQVAIHFRDAPDEAAVRALLRMAAGDAAAAALTFAAIEEADWVAQSLAGLAPVRAGRFIVHGAHDRARVPVNAIGIEIEAALAFGTGHHGTTRGCLLALDAVVKRKAKRRPLFIPPLKGEGRREAPGWGQPRRNHSPTRLVSLATLPPKRGRDKIVLDLGTGSGVLAIAAARTWHTRVVAGDIDPVAVASARANARLNRATGITFLRATGAKSPVIAAGAPYALIFANILLGPLLRLAVPIRRLAGRHARVVLSGLLPAHANAVLSIYRAQDFALERRIVLDGWVTLVLRSG
jgi:ribosomal protein L11 methyltransferase